MAKHVAIDSLARSGTTLLSAILRSQEKTMVFCPGFNEPMACRVPEHWPHSFCRRDFVEQDVEINFDKFKRNSLSQIKEFAQYNGLSEEEWKSIIFDAKSPEEVRENIEQAFPKVEVFGYRWNQTLCYFNRWANKGKNHLWLSMIRDPIDRAVSSNEKHGWSWKDSLENTVSFSNKVEEIEQHNQFGLFYYEDLVENPKKVISEMYDFFDVTIEDINLVDVKGSNGKDFIPQSSKLKGTRKKDGYVVGEKYSGLYKNVINRHKEMPNNHRKSFRDSIKDVSVYERYFK
tara:strand:- start:30 stop:893 length:864 start_codon:yes stop_codon:yes gene_type:complete